MVRPATTRPPLPPHPHHHPTKYAHRPAPSAILTGDHTALRAIVAGLPTLFFPPPGPPPLLTHTEAQLEEQKAAQTSAVLDRRDVPNRDSPLHLAVRLDDPTSAEILMAAGADWSLQNEQGWNALQEAIFRRQPEISAIIVRHYYPLAWTKWCRRLPRLRLAMGKMRDFYMEIDFRFESSVIPFVGRVAPSDTYRIWKRGSDLRADMSLAGFDGFRIQRADQSFLFFGHGSNGSASGSLLVLTHKDKKVVDALEGAGARPSEAEVEKEVAAMARSSIYRPGVDVTMAELVPLLTWRRQIRAEMVGPWKAKVYEMRNVSFSVKSRRAPPPPTPIDVTPLNNLNEEEKSFMKEMADIDKKAKGDPNHGSQRRSCYGKEASCLDDGFRTGNANGAFSGQNVGFLGKNAAVSGCGGLDSGDDGWFSGEEDWFSGDQGRFLGAGERRSVYVEGKVGGLMEEESGFQSSESGFPAGRRSLDSIPIDEEDGGKKESEFRRGLRPVIWLTEEFPLETEELLPLLDILADKVKAVRRLRELLTTKFPNGTFPVKVSIPVVPTIKVVITFTKFEEWKQESNELSTPSRNPNKQSWLQWVKSPYSGAVKGIPAISSDPFAIPSDYTWVKSGGRKGHHREKKSPKDREKKQKGKRV
ncbi:hypothetical protein AMTRI_Chr09g33990 [Amborella trichopoda]